MAYLTDQSSFAAFSLTEEEQVEGCILTITQRQVIQNNISMAAESKLALEMDVNDMQSYIQKEAGLTGQIDAYRYMLDMHDASEELRNNPKNK
jgi:hypothetical protein